MSRAQKVGKTGEAIAVSYLQSLGLDILERNFRAHRGEIDIIAREEETLVFVEVKSSSGDSFGEPLTWVNRRKKQKIARTAEAYLLIQNCADVECRFDVIAVSIRNNGHDIKHIKNAFWLED
jgi:putative endonuclease